MLVYQRVDFICVFPAAAGPLEKHQNRAWHGLEATWALADLSTVSQSCKVCIWGFLKLGFRIKTILVSVPTNYPKGSKTSTGGSPSHNGFQYVSILKWSNMVDDLGYPHDRNPPYWTSDVTRQWNLVSIWNPKFPVAHDLVQISPFKLPFWDTRNQTWLAGIHHLVRWLSKENTMYGWSSNVSWHRRSCHSSASPRPRRPPRCRNQQTTRHKAVWVDAAVKGNRYSWPWWCQQSSATSWGFHGNISGI